jgi:hypothetical protein
MDAKRATRRSFVLALAAAAAALAPGQTDG